MREIKFRAWDTEENRWFPKGNTEWININNSGDVIFGFEDGDPELGEGRFEIIQYTGLKDKNGKEVYEGDIIKTLSDEGDWNKSTNGIHLVEFWNGQFVFNAERSEDDDYINFGWWVRSNKGMNKLHQIEVIGNIYENPELLEVK